MANKKTLQRKKPGYTKNGEVKIVSLNYQQLHDLISKTSKKKIETKIRKRMQMLEKRKRSASSIVLESACTSES
jgi:hypothetical protein